ncbi:MAG: hypothetical protein AB8B88_04070 [Devosiaceae bacterium]
MDFLTPTTLTVLMIGSTHYIDIGAPKDAVIYYESATQAHMVLPDGVAFSGIWHTTEDGYHVAWTDGPSGNWRLNYSPGRIGYVNAEGTELGTITRIVFGNAENLPEN